jgi:hydrogenase expression/formation protein HypD
MIRVPGSGRSLQEAKATGADVRIMYSPLDAVKLARENPEYEVVFFAVGFETTAPANAFSVYQAHMLGVKNYSILTSHVLVPPAIRAIMDDPETRVQGFLAAGHVCTVMGLDEYVPISEKYKIPIVVTGFEPVDLLQGISMMVRQLENGEYRVENQYARVVKEKGNTKAKELIRSVFEVQDRIWRGLDVIPESGFELKESYREYDARYRFNLAQAVAAEEKDCISGDIMKGIKKPPDCPNFGTRCTPLNPLGAPMVSSEGACAAYFHYASETIKNDS